jgi:hypothetical protein
MAQRPCVQIFGPTMGLAIQRRYEERTQVPCCRHERGDTCFLLDRTGHNPLLDIPPQPADELCAEAV